MNAFETAGLLVSVSKLITAPLAFIMSATCRPRKIKEARAAVGTGNILLGIFFLEDVPC